MHKLHPADELADIRAEISRLKEREAALRQLLLQRPELAAQGRWSRVELVTQTQSRFVTALLPPDILNDPRFRRERQLQILRCLPIAAAPPASRPGWPIRREGAALH